MEYEVVRAAPVVTPPPTVSVHLTRDEHRDLLKVLNKSGPVERQVGVSEVLMYTFWCGLSEAYEDAYGEAYSA